MAEDYGKGYSEIVYFSGLWDGCQDTGGGHDALAVLCEAVSQCRDHDQRERPDVRAALAYLDRWSGCQVRLNALRKAFDVPDPTGRQLAARAAFLKLRDCMT